MSHQNKNSSANLPQFYDAYSRSTKGAAASMDFHGSSLYDWFQLNISNFSMCALISEHQKTGTQLSQPTFKRFIFE